MADELDLPVATQTIVALHRSIATLRTRVAELEGERDKLRQFFENIALECWGGADVEQSDFHDWGVAAGVLVEVPASDDIREEFETETMFTWSWSCLAPTKDPT